MVFYGICLDLLQEFYLENAHLWSNNITFVQDPQKCDFLDGYAAYCRAFTFYDEVVDGGCGGDCCCSRRAGIMLLLCGFGGGGGYAVCRTFTFYDEVVDGGFGGDCCCCRVG
jgi:hypothetical protein